MHHRLSTLRFMPVGWEVSRSLIHLLSQIVRSTGSFLHDASIITTDMSSGEWLQKVKCLTVKYIQYNTVQYTRQYIKVKKKTKQNKYINK